ncbi:hypothetical protein ACOALA_17710 [Alicyclobacillus acidoterrestris]|uniref:Uncharacterized protein n=1 Tax=Alicyclobacillus acidoterrestris (strain ATCC 49025 / DSM 3922 / CIP 106132 / NCIMB 13137 / GD3B) TaxID=1356854 RepID=T0CUS1_ALIAG|nr:hypothetical protein [Alicyclobacillus acidoterrestris]EPZ43122.1 hypothetical protein N007_13780 [Alicyclobacillus acidoterrestris ATCC 49025]UNO49874.1 hypothetical protein K1I37_05035 [Alicyclobacillus acidoterrestris]
MPTHDIIIGLIIALPIAFLVGRYSTRVTFFHTRTEEKISVPEFLRTRE